MKALVTGGAGFIGRWLVKKLLEENFQVWVIDNLENGRESNLDEFKNHPGLKRIVYDNILNEKALHALFEARPDIVYHLAAQINVHESLENPKKSYEINIRGTYNVLEECRALGTKLMLMGTCMVYDMAESHKPIHEAHPLKPTSPYAASKLSAEILAQSYYHSYGLPVVTCRPFNTYGPFQKYNLEGGVVSIFVRQALNGESLTVYGDGTQTRDLLYVEDCADFIYRASLCPQAVGEVINAGSGSDIPIIELARMVCPDPKRIRFVDHHHPQSEIKKLVSDYSKARRLLDWEPRVDLATGIEKLRRQLQEICVSA
ncbi:MAG: NAD-dependent epimerase/dehydratase family protein [Nitrospinaceae bacterium]|nr:NAD-dependent epimerase/dehydratase family protein [Nitrospinaceae bacterium]NIR55232.1 NAD-dependent epimerase/dehydratase family protein [Nitrospinaceae bacterium]NIS85666.1 NAD-dependent epimerase/dehydratase family protein [Nitrospinaceae bacterium]NIT82511.1 NAD-dependent epimerase/dehydratase family protein [Nitrospinaceae bacterium]NIU44716.1 NAD-dependent epimerase/dehydratase family protein [Nitrospinaceae bacterium]